MDTIDELTNVLRNFRDKRDWEQFHNPKDLALALSVEASELLELFLWKKYEDVDRGKIEEEIADVLSYLLLLADGYNINIKQVLLKKVELNEIKYPVSKSKGTSKKYNEL
jgi:NTP pyrophosphatase (non-canonical NTP hydrolase)